MIIDKKRQRRTDGYVLLCVYKTQANDPYMMDEEWEKRKML